MPPTHCDRIQIEAPFRASVSVLLGFGLDGDLVAIKRDDGRAGRDCFHGFAEPTLLDALRGFLPFHLRALTDTQSVDAELVVEEIHSAAVDLTGGAGEYLLCVAGDVPFRNGEAGEARRAALILVESNPNERAIVVRTRCDQHAVVAGVVEHIRQVNVHQEVSKTGIAAVIQKSRMEPQKHVAEGDAGEAFDGEASCDFAVVDIEALHLISRLA